MPETERDRAEWVEEALARYEGPLVRYATRMTGDVEVARDVVQDTFLKLCTADREKVEEHLASWLYTVCRNRALDVRRKEGRMGRLKDPRTIRDESGGPGEEAARNEAHGLVLEALERLPEDQQEAFRLKFQDNLTYRQIGRVMGKSLGTVSRLVTGALTTIRNDLRAGGALAQEI